MTGTAPSTRQTAGDRNRPEPLAVRATLDLWEPVHRAAGLWNANPSPTDDGPVWDRLGDRPAFDGRVANRFAGAELPVSGGAADPPFRVAVELQPPSAGVDAFVDGTVDLGRVDRTARRTDPDRTAGGSDVVRHDLGRDGWAFVVSPALAASVDALTADQIRRVYAGEVENWRALGGPDAEPYTFLGPHVDGWDPTYQKFLRAGEVSAPELDARLGQARNQVAVTAERDDALGVVSAEDVRLARERGVPTLDVVVDGDRHSPYDDAYPLTTPVPLHTLGDPDPRERAFLGFLSSAFGQRALVGRELLPLRPVDGW